MLEKQRKPARGIWNQAFKLVALGNVKFGEKNRLVVRVHYSKYAGDIFSTVRLRAAR